MSSPQSCLTPTFQNTAVHNVDADKFEWGKKVQISKVSSLYHLVILAFYHCSVNEAQRVLGVKHYTEICPYLKPVNSVCQSINSSHSTREWTQLTWLSVGCVSVVVSASGWLWVRLGWSTALIYSVLCWSRSRFMLLSWNLSHGLLLLLLAQCPISCFVFLQ